MMRAIKWFAFVAVVAVAVHFTAVFYLPNIIMWRVTNAMAAKGVNTITHGERPTAASRAVVKPSPDLLYSYCAFDVSRAPLKIITAAPTETYWSVAFYASNTDNFFVLNDKQAKSQPVTIVLIGQNQVVPPQPEGTLIVSAPAPKGIILFRTLVNDDAREPEIDRQRRAAKCEPL
ncbi:MAG: DUF1254 domain-containing protein [Alphaproteobacteria bacterium]|nr:DUF1254 domain-containing protein [Alphaproteobacteria bacterium]